MILRTEGCELDSQKIKRNMTEMVWFEQVGTILDLLTKDNFTKLSVNPTHSSVQVPTVCLI